MARTRGRVSIRHITLEWLELEPTLAARRTDWLSHLLPSPNPPTEPQREREDQLLEHAVRWVQHRCRPNNDGVRPGRRLPGARQGGEEVRPFRGTRLIMRRCDSIDAVEVDTRGGDEFDVAALQALLVVPQGCSGDDPA